MRKKPLECAVPDYTNSENAVVDAGLTWPGTELTEAGRVASHRTCALCCARGVKSWPSPQPPSPYETRLNLLHGPLEVIDVHAIEDARNYKWFNQSLCKVNDSVVRVGIVEGEYHWHKHDDDDEFFYVVERMLLIDLEGRTVELAPGQGFVVPREVVHRTRAPKRTTILMVENAGIIPTGN